MDSFEHIKHMRQIKKDFQEVMAAFDAKRREFDFTRMQVNTIRDMNERLKVNPGLEKDPLMEDAIKQLSKRTNEVTQEIDQLNTVYKTWFNIEPGVSST